MELENTTDMQRDQDSHPRLVMPRFIAVMGGADWADASVDHVVIPEGMNLEDEQSRWREWYHGTYCPLLHTDNRVDYVSFVDWIKREGARDATEIEEFWET